jgi:phosphoribosylanthranilate isomerase
VGVFADEAPELVVQLIESGIIGIAQLHGHEDEGYIRRLRSLTRAPILKAFPVGSDGGLAAAKASSADHVLLDHGSGGTGRSFDWNLLQGFPRPFFLAGGLDPLNVERAIRSARPCAVDVSSGVETDGVKDLDKMRRFLRAARKDPA